MWTIGQTCRMRRTVLVAVLLVAGMFLLVPEVASATEFNSLSKYEEVYGVDSVKTVADVLRNVRVGLFKALRLLLLIASLAMLVLTAINVMQGDSGAAKRLFMWAIGLAIGLALLSIVANHGTYAPVDKALTRANSFSGIKQTVGDAMQVALSIVSMIMLVVVSIHVMRGEKDGFEKLLKWLIASVLGITLLNII